MLNTFNDDRRFIEQKYHNHDENFNPYNRMAYHGEGYIKETGLCDEEILEGLNNLKIDGLPHPVARAKAIEYVLKSERLYINEHDYFVGLYSLNRLANKVTFDKWQKESFAMRKTTELEGLFNESGAMSIWTDYDHVVPDWKSLVELGFCGIRQRARDYKKIHIENKTMTDEMLAFFDGIEIEYTAIIDLIDRMYKTTENLKFEKCEKIKQSLKHLRDGAPRDIYDAMQLILIYFLVSESIDSYQVRSLGNGLDNTLYSFYKADLENGTYTREEIKNFLRYFLMQWSAIGNYWGQPFYMGGTDENANTKYNELSYDILDVYDELEIYNPKIQLKINTNTPDRLLKKAFDMVRRKNASIVFCCEPGMIKAVMGYGATYEEALNMDIRGCYETGVRANEVCSASGYVNASKAVEYVFTNGFDVRINKQVGIKTGAIDTIKTFEDFYFALLKQWEYLIEQSIKITNDAEKYLSYVNPSSMYSATVQTSLEKGVDGYCGGVKFNNNCILNCAFASAVDSVLAVKEFVFDKKEIQLTELAQILQKNWNGYELLRKKIENSPHKYGNNDDLADTYASAMADFFSDKVNNTPNLKGGVYKAIMHSAMQFVWQGEKTGALPNGRRAGEELSKNASTSIGADKNGVTALIESAVKLSPSNYRESFCLDVTLHPSVVSGEGGYMIFKGILMTYLKKDGMSIQFNILNTDTLHDAQKNPEKYKNLQIRVCGWNVLWNNLSKSEQDAYILKSENIQ